MEGRGRVHVHVESLSVMSRRFTKALVIISFQIVLIISLGGGLPCEIAAMLVALLRGGNQGLFVSGGVFRTKYQVTVAVKVSFALHVKNSQEMVDLSLLKWCLLGSKEAC